MGRDEFPFKTRVNDSKQFKAMVIWARMRVHEWLLFASNAGNKNGIYIFIYYYQWLT